MTTPNNGAATVCMLIAAIPVVAVLAVALFGAAFLWLLGVGIVAGFQGAGMIIDYLIGNRPVTETAGGTRS